MIISKEVTLDLLELELRSAGIAVPLGLGKNGNELHTYNEAGTAVDLPSEAAPIIDRHQPKDVKAERAEKLAILRNRGNSLPERLDALINLLGLE
jgi:hypothetical protein